MNIGLLNIMHTKKWDFRPDLAQTYADALKNAIELRLPNDVEKQHGYFLSKKGYQKEGKVLGANFEDKLYVGNIHRIESHLYYEDEVLADDDQIVNVVVIDGPVTRDGDACSYGTKDFRDQVMYANTIPQVVGHLFIINTPGGQAECRNDYEMMINDCREKGKPTVGFIDGGCYSSGVNLTSRLDRVIVMNPRDGFGCIGTMAAFWAVAHDTVSQDGYRYVELVGKDCPEKNDWYREAAAGEYEKLQAELDKDTDEFHQTVREGRPLVTDDMLTGKVFEAQEVIPALVDEIGDINRAIECLFELADEKLTAARFMVAEPKGENDGDAGEDTDTHAAVAMVNAQETETTTPKNENNMTQEDNGQLTVDNGQLTVDNDNEGAPVKEQVHAVEEETTETTKSPENLENPEETTPAEEAPASEEEKPADEEQPAEEETPTEEPAGEQPAEEEQPTEEAVADAQAEIDKIQETLHNAEMLVEQKDKEIADKVQEMENLQKSIDELKSSHANEVDEKAKEIENLNAQLSTLNDQLSEKDATIEKLQKQVDDLNAEVKELAGKPTPMTDEKSGIPAGNGTGEAPKENKHQRIKRGMSYDEIREAMKN